MIKKQQIFLALAMTIGGSQQALAGCLPETIYFTRHAEKLHESGNRDPDLSDKGHQRAKRLADLLKDKPVNALFATPYKRTQQTLTPLSEQSKLAITQYDPRDEKGFVEKIKQDYCDKTLVVAGHSNTVPSLLQAFGVKFEVTVGGHKFAYQASVILSEKEFGQLFAVSFDNQQAKLEVLSTNG